MSNIPIGQEFDDYVTMIDESGNEMTGVVFVEVVSADPIGNPFPWTYEELPQSAGTYHIQYTPTILGNYTLIYKSLTDPAQYWDSSVVAGPAALGTTPAAAAAGVTLQDLIRMTATALSDLLELTATQDGAANGGTWIDELNASAISPTSLKGAELFVTVATGDNLHRLARVLDSTAGTVPTLTLVPPLPGQVLAGDQADLTNLESHGFRRQQYVRAINSVIARQFPNYLVPVAYDVPAAFDSLSPYFDAPASLTHLYGIEYQAAGTGAWLPIKRTITGAQGEGWWWDPVNQKLAIGGYAGAQASSRTIRLLGYGKQPPLVEPTDATMLDAEWLVNEAAAILGRSKGDPQKLALAQIDKGDADLVRAKMATNLMPDTVQLRW